jgi:lactate permease
MNFLLAFLPILLILVLMVGFRWGASRAGPAGYLAALLIAAGIFGAGIELLAYAHTKALLLTLDVLMIVWAAYLHYRVADEAGAVRMLGELLPRLTRDTGMLALLLGYVFASFLQGVGGFGVPVAVVAPMLIGLGFSPLLAVVIPAVGHSWAVTFGSLGSSFQALMAATGLAWHELAGPAAALLGTAGLGAGLMVVHAADGWRGVRRLWPAVLTMSLVMGVVQYWMAGQELWNIAAFGGSAAGLLISVPLARVFRGAGQPEKQATLGLRQIWLASAGYIFLVVVTVGVQLVPPVKAFLGQVSLELPFPELQTSLGFVTPAGAGRTIRVFSHAGFLLVYASILGYLVYQRAGMYRPGAAARIVKATLKGVLSSSVGILAMVSMAVVMSHAGMTDVLARSLAENVNRAFPAVSMWIGVLGAFMTGSNTNSNVVFAALQLRTAQLLHYSIPVILAAQTTGGAIGSVIAPTKVVVGASTAGMEGREGEVIRRLAVYVVLLILVLSGGVWLWLR